MSINEHNTRTLSNQDRILWPTRLFAITPGNDDEHWTERLAIRYTDIANHFPKPMNADNFKALLACCKKAQAKVIDFEAYVEKQQLKKDDFPDPEVPDSPEVVRTPFDALGAVASALNQV